MAWHTINSEPSTSSQGQEEESSQTFCLGTYLSELARSRNTRETSCCNGCETESCQCIQSGTTSAHSTELRGAASLMSWLEASPALTSQSASKMQKDSTERKAGYGLKCSVLYASAIPTKYLWRIAQCLFPEDLEESYMTFPQSGIFADTLLWEATKPALAQTEKGSGYTLQRPTASDGKRFKEYKLKSLVRPHHPNGNLSEQLAQRGMRRLTPECAEILMRWPEGWTDLKPLETDKIQSWRQQHGARSN